MFDSQVAAENGEGKGWVGYVLRLNSREEIEKRIARGVVTRGYAREGIKVGAKLSSSPPREKELKTPAFLLRRLFVVCGWMDMGSINRVGRAPQAAEYRCKNILWNRRI